MESKDDDVLLITMKIKECVYIQRWVSTGRITYSMF